ncbi:MAG: branched-chain amino acid ABC transporter permease [Sulfolobales archaeon]
MKRYLLKHSTLLILFIIYLLLWSLKELKPEYSQLIVQLVTYATIAQAYNIFLGMTGYVDFGYVSYYGLGLYGMAIAIKYASERNIVPEQAVALGVLLSLLMAGLIASVVGGIALRLRGAYFAIATIGLSQALRYFIEGTGLWGGSEGLIIARDLREIFGEERFSYATIILPDIGIFVSCLISTIVLYVVRVSRLGLGLLAVREDEDAAEVLGVNTVRYKFLAFIISALLASVVGSMWSLKVTAIFPPESFNIAFSVEAIVITMLGGAGTILGPLVGASLYTLSKYFLGVMLPGFQLLIFSLLLIPIVVVFRQGIVGEVRILLFRVKILREIIR